MGFSDCSSWGTAARIAGATARLFAGGPGWAAVVELVEPAGPWQDKVAANLAAATAAGLTLGSASLYMPLGWFGAWVTTVALVLGCGCGALAALKLRAWLGLGWRTAAAAPRARPQSR